MSIPLKEIIEPDIKQMRSSKYVTLSVVIWDQFIKILNAIGSGIAIAIFIIVVIFILSWFFN